MGLSRGGRRLRSLRSLRVGSSLGRSLVSVSSQPAGLGMSSLTDTSFLLGDPIAGQWVYGWRGRVAAPQLGPVLRRLEPLAGRRRIIVAVGRQRVRLGVARLLPGLGQQVRLGVARRLPGLGRQRVARLPTSLLRARGQPQIDARGQPQKLRSVLRRQSVRGRRAMRAGDTTWTCMRSSDQRAKLRRLTKPDILETATTRRAPGAGSTR